MRHSRGINSYFFVALIGEEFGAVSKSYLEWAREVLPRERGANEQTVRRE
jgi:hypothetical protein